MNTQSIARLTVLGLAFALTGCKTVEPWERGYLASSIMRTDGDPCYETMTEHGYFSREAAFGGKGVGGGGCGCN